MEIAKKYNQEERNKIMLEAIAILKSKGYFSKKQ